MTRKRLVRAHSGRPITWLPVDSRILLPLFSFGHVHGIAKIFLMVEMIFAVFVVVGSLVLFSFHFIY